MRPHARAREPVEARVFIAPGIVEAVEALLSTGLADELIASQVHVSDFLVGCIRARLKWEQHRNAAAQEERVRLLGGGGAL